MTSEEAIYLDSSVLIRMLFAESEPDGLNHNALYTRFDSHIYASEIAGVEVRRSCDRLRLQNALDDQLLGDAQQQFLEIESRYNEIRLTSHILSRASMPMATAIKTLDAIHLATALTIRENLRLSVTFATHDQKQANAARALGFPCLGMP